MALPYVRQATSPLVERSVHVPERRTRAFGDPYSPPVALACDVYDVRLQVGRVLTGHLLAGMTALRGLVLTFGTFGMADGGTAALSWVVVSRRDDATEVARIPAGREPGVGEQLVASVRASTAELEDAAVLERWSLPTG